MAKKFDFLSPGIEIREIDQSFIPQERDAEGPIIIGRTRKGPANKPVKIRNLDDYVSVFGLPVAGGNGAQGDIWREGNTVGPTYASYAAQAWLASENSPITVVRLAGEQHSSNDGSATALAGWQVGTGGVTNAASTNATAYGLFVCDSADAAEASSQTLDFSAFDVTKLGEVGGSPAFGVLSFFHKASLAASPAFNVAGGLVFQINFDETATKGEIVKLSNAGGQGASGLGRSQTGGVVNVYSIGIASTPSETEVIGYIETAIEQAIANGDISDISVDNNGTSLTIYNLSTTKEFNLADKSQAGTHGASAYANFRFSGTLNNAYGTEIAVATGGVSNGSLAAVFYCAKGSLTLHGNLAHGTPGSGAEKTLAGSLVENVADKLEFRMKIFDESDAQVDDIVFNFKRNSSKYIRNVFNTNPQLTNSDTIEAADLKTYWLGESFVDHLDTNVDLDAADGAAFGILLPLGMDDTAEKNWGYHRYAAREAKSGWVFSDRDTGEKKLFRFKSMHVGEEIQRNYLIAIEQITAPQNSSVNAYGSFTVCIKDVAGNTVERYTGCDLNPASPNYVAARIGDQYQEWSDTDKRYRTYGDFQNQSNIFYIEMAETVSNGGGQGLLPAGFFGPVRPKGFGLLADEAEAKSLDLGSDFTGSLARVADDTNLIRGHDGTTGAVANLGTKEAVKFTFPQLRMRNNGSDGGASDQARTYWGVRPKIDANSNQHDPDYCDYLRGLGMGVGEEGTHQTFNADLFEYSFIFSLNDVSGAAGGNIWSWTSGAYGDGSTGTSHTGDGSGKTFADLLDEGVRQFIMPVWGGSEGFDITEMEPLRNGLISTTALSETTKYVDYTISKALDSVSDAEVVPANLLVLPGINKPAVTNKMINVAESRKDILSIIDLQNDYVPRVESKDNASTRLGSVTAAISSLKSRNLNSSYAAAFYPAVQISDNLNASQLVWVPASVAALGALGKSQAQSDVWFAPAGFNRGGLGSLGGSRGPKVLQARQRLDSKERDLLYEQNINPIATFPAEGVVIFGQKTLQADASALDRINVRRLVLYLKSRVATVARNLLFDQNVESTWNRFKSQVNPILADTRARFGLSDYKLILDETTTTADLVDRNIMYAKIYIKPARAIEYIVVDFVITRTGADFV